MPGKVTKQGDQWCVQWKGEQDKCYENKGKADARLKALYANSPDTEKSNRGTRRNRKYD